MSQFLTVARPVRHMVIGTLLLALLLLAGLWENAFDICARVGEECRTTSVFMATLGIGETVMVTAVAIGAVLVAVLSFSATWRRTGGEHLLSLSIGPRLRNLVVSAVTLTLCAPLIYLAIRRSWFAYAALVGHPDATGGEFYNDPDMVRGFALISPIVCIATVVWLLALRSIALSPRVGAT